MTMRPYASLFALTVAGILSIGAASAQQGVNVADGEKKDGSPVAKYLQMSRDLVTYGRANNNPLALVVAAQLRSQVQLKEVDRKPATEGGEGAAKDDTAAISVDSILAEAKKLSNDDAAIVALADDVKAAATKGRLAGPGYNVNVVPGRGTDRYSGVTFVGGRYAEIYAEGSGRSDLDLYVYDQNGNLICSDTDASDVVYCGWTPRWTGNFTIRVVNRGLNANRYALITN